MSEKLLKTTETCEALNVSRSGLWRMQRAGLITPIHLIPGGRTVRYREADVLKLKKAS